MNSINRYIALSLLILFGISQSAVWHISYQIIKHRAHHREANIKVENQYLILTYEQFLKAKEVEKDELLIKGRMFDVEWLKFEKETVVLYGHFDVEEDNLLAASKKHESKEQQHSGSYDFPVLFFEELIYSYKYVAFYEDTEKYSPYAEKLSCLNLMLDSPPPKFV